MIEARFDYARYKTREGAESALEDMFAAGEVSEGEFPRIEKRVYKPASWSRARTSYVITLPA